MDKDGLVQGSSAFADHRHVPVAAAAAAAASQHTDTVLSSTAPRKNDSFKFVERRGHNSTTTKSTVAQNTSRTGSVKFLNTFAKGFPSSSSSSSSSSSATHTATSSLRRTSSGSLSHSLHAKKLVRQQSQGNTRPTPVSTSNPMSTFTGHSSTVRRMIQGSGKLKSQSQRTTGSSASQKHATRTKHSGPLSASHSSTQPRLVEDTEPEQVYEGEIRCICGIDDDDGSTIQCERCMNWQHMICVGISIDNEPEQYFCEECAPRFVDVDRARKIQQRRLKMEELSLNESAERSAAQTTLDVSQQQQQQTLLPSSSKSNQAFNNDLSHKSHLSRPQPSQSRVKKNAVSTLLTAHSTTTTDTTAYDGDSLAMDPMSPSAASLSGAASKEASLGDASSSLDVTSQRTQQQKRKYSWLKSFQPSSEALSEQMRVLIDPLDGDKSGAAAGLQPFGKQSQTSSHTAGNVLRHHNTFDPQAVLNEMPASRTSLHRKGREDNAIQHQHSQEPQEPGPKEDTARAHLHTGTHSQLKYAPWSKANGTTSTGSHPRQPTSHSKTVWQNSKEQKDSLQRLVASCTLNVKEMTMTSLLQYALDSQRVSMSRNAMSGTGSKGSKVDVAHVEQQLMAMLAFVQRHPEDLEQQPEWLTELTGNQRSFLNHLGQAYAGHLQHHRTQMKLSHRLLENFIVEEEDAGKHVVHIAENAYTKDALAALSEAQKAFADQLSFENQYLGVLFQIMTGRFNVSVQEPGDLAAHSATSTLDEATQAAFTQWLTSISERQRYNLLHHTRAALPDLLDSFHPFLSLHTQTTLKPLVSNVDVQDEEAISQFVHQLISQAKDDLLGETSTLEKNHISLIHGLPHPTSPEHIGVLAENAYLLMLHFREQLKHSIVRLNKTAYETLRGMSENKTHPFLETRTVSSFYDTQLLHRACSELLSEAILNGESHIKKDESMDASGTAFPASTTEQAHLPLSQLLKSHVLNNDSETPSHILLDTIDFNARLSRQVKRRFHQIQYVIDGFSDPQLGVFAKEPLSQDQCLIEQIGIWEQGDTFLTNSDTRALTQWHSMVSFHPTLDLCIDARKYGNMSRYVRYSCRPNVEVRNVIVPGDARLHLCLFALRPIKAGEELTLPLGRADVTLNSFIQCSQEIVHKSKTPAEAARKSCFGDLLLSLQDLTKIFTIQQQQQQQQNYSDTIIADIRSHVFTKDIYLAQAAKRLSLRERHAQFVENRRHLVICSCAGWRQEALKQLYMKQEKALFAAHSDLGRLMSQHRSNANKAPPPPQSTSDPVAGAESDNMAALLTAVSEDLQKSKPFDASLASSSSTEQKSPPSCHLFQYYMTAHSHTKKFLLVEYLNWLTYLLDGMQPQLQTKLRAVLLVDRMDALQRKYLMADTRDSSTKLPSHQQDVESTAPIRRKQQQGLSGADSSGHRSKTHSRQRSQESFADADVSSIKPLQHHTVEHTQDLENDASHPREDAPSRSKVTSPLQSSFVSPLSRAQQGTFSQKRPFSGRQKVEESESFPPDVSSSSSASNTTSHRSTGHLASPVKQEKLVAHRSISQHHSTTKQSSASSHEHKRHSFDQQHSTISENSHSQASSVAAPAAAPASDAKMSREERKLQQIMQTFDRMEHKQKKRKSMDQPSHSSTSQSSTSTLTSSTQGQDQSLHHSVSQAQTTAGTHVSSSQKARKLSIAHVASSHKEQQQQQQQQQQEQEQQEHHRQVDHSENTTVNEQPEETQSTSTAPLTLKTTTADASLQKTTTHHLAKSAPLAAADATKSPFRKSQQPSPQQQYTTTSPIPSVNSTSTTTTTTTTSPQQALQSGKDQLLHKSSFTTSRLQSPKNTFVREEKERVEKHLEENSHNDNDDDDDDDNAVLDVADSPRMSLLPRRPSVTVASPIKKESLDSIRLLQTLPVDQDDYVDVTMTTEDDSSHRVPPIATPTSTLDAIFRSSPNGHMRRSSSGAAVDKDSLKITASSPLDSHKRLTQISMKDSGSDAKRSPIDPFQKSTPLANTVTLNSSVSDFTLAPSKTALSTSDQEHSTTYFPNTSAIIGKEANLVQSSSSQLSSGAQSHTRQQTSTSASSIPVSTITPQPSLGSPQPLSEATPAPVKATPMRISFLDYKKRKSEQQNNDSPTDSPTGDRQQQNPFKFNTGVQPLSTGSSAAAASFSLHNGATTDLTMASSTSSISNSNSNSTGPAKDVLFSESKRLSVDGNSLQQQDQQSSTASPSLVHPDVVALVSRHLHGSNASLH